jgi:hypothetical protein
MNILNKQPDHLAALNQWAEWGKVYGRPRSSRPNWSAVDALIDAAQPRLRADSEALRELLVQSRNQLKFSDPLLSDLGAHRWLEMDREESYSDWLAWVLERLRDVGLVLHVLGVQNPQFVSTCLGRCYTVEREAAVTEGSLGCNGRVDIVVHFGDPEVALLGVEVKTCDKQYEKQQGYIRSLQQFRRAVECVLVDSDEVPEDKLFGFKLRTWEGLAVALRQAIAAYVRKSDGGEAIPAMMLGFVSAVERNLLGYGTVAPRRAWENRPALRPEGFFIHLQKAVGGEHMTAVAPSRNDLFLQGAERYLDALAAIEAFERDVQRTCTQVYQQHATELAKQMGLDAAECEKYCDNDPEERCAWVGVSRPAQKGCKFYLYLAWDEAEGGNARIQGTIYLGLYHKDLRDSLYERLRQKNPLCRVSKDETYQLTLTSLIKPDKLSSAAKILDDLVLEWLAYCKSIGGLGLKKCKTP